MLNKKIIEEIEKGQLKKEIVQFNVGDTIKVFSEIREGDKKRMQGFEGIVIKRQGGQTSRATFTVRRLVQGVGVERTFPVHSPKVGGISVNKKGSVRRAKLYYLRTRIGSAASRIDEKKA